MIESPSEVCPSREALAAFQRGILPPETLERVASHLSRCERCEATLGGLQDDSIIAQLRTVGRPQPLLAEPECSDLEARARALGVEPGTPTVDLDRPPAAGQWHGPHPFGPYDLLGVLGSGGMGLVYKARQRIGAGERLVALKTLPLGCQADPDAQARFQTEGAAVARLSHPNVVQIYEFAEHDGQPYFSMELVEGGNLSDRLNGGPLAPRDAALLVRALAQAVQAAHGQNVVHRDLKPSNILLTTAGEPKISDFGLAKLLDERGLAQTLTEAVLGTPSYMAPEQAAGQARAVGPLSDVYALGAILYETLTGRPPFKGASRQHTLELVRTRDPEAPRRLRPDLHRDLEAVCLKCLEKEPRRRYPSAAALAEDLDNWLHGRNTRARPQGLLARAARAARRRPLLAGAAALLLVAAGLGLGACYYFNPERPLHNLEASLARGQAQTIIGEQGPPAWFEPVAGRETCQTAVGPDGFFTIHTRGQTLLELVRDPHRERFRIRAALRHDHPVILFGSLGLYVARRAHATDGGVVHHFAAMTFYDLRDDRDDWDMRREVWKKHPNPPPRPPGNMVALDPHLYSDGTGESWEPGIPIGGARRFFDPAGFSGGVWRELALEVTPEGVRGFWGGEEVGLLTADEVVAPAQGVADHAHPPYAAFSRGLRPEFVPRGGLGLYVNRGSASFRHVVVEPLDSTPFP